MERERTILIARIELRTFVKNRKIHAPVYTCETMCGKLCRNVQDGVLIYLFTTVYTEVSKFQFWLHFLIRGNVEMHKIPQSGFLRGTIVHRSAVRHCTRWPAMSHSQLIVQKVNQRDPHFLIPRTHIAWRYISPHVSF